MKVRRGLVAHPARWVIGAVLATALTAAGPAAFAGASAAAGSPHYNQGNRHGGGSGGSNLIDHRGLVLSGPNVVSIFWGPPTDFSGGSGVAAGIQNFLTSLNGSPYLNIATQYMRGASLNIGSINTASDPSSPPTHSPSVATIVNEVGQLVGTPDANTVYLVFTSNFPKGGGFCAWHSWGLYNGIPVTVAYLPNVVGLTGCESSLAGNTYTLAAQSQVDDTAHEFMESITDPQLNAWYDQSGQEIGDKCETDLTSVTVGTTAWQLQKEWSNATSTCSAG